MERGRSCRFDAFIAHLRRCVPCASARQRPAGPVRQLRLRWRAINARNRAVSLGPASTRSACAAISWVTSAWPATATASPAIRPALRAARSASNAPASCRSITQHEHALRGKFLDEACQRVGLGRGSGWSHLECPASPGAEQDPRRIDCVSDGHDTGPRRIDIRRSAEVERQRRALVLEHQPGLIDDSRDLDLESLGHGRGGRVGRLAHDRQCRQTETTTSIGPLGAMITVVAGTTDSGARRQVHGGAAADERHMDVRPGSQPAQSTLGDGDDGRGPRVEAELGERAIEVARQQQTPIEEGLSHVERPLRTGRPIGVRSQRGSPRVLAASGR